MIMEDTIPYTLYIHSTDWRSLNHLFFDYEVSYSTPYYMITFERVPTSVIEIYKSGDLSIAQFMEEIDAL